MNRLQTELQRLYFLASAGEASAGEQGAGAAGPQAGTRAMVLELGRPAQWNELARVWHGVQADLELPAPAIAVSGLDGFQLWFSLAQPLPVAQAGAFLQALGRRYLGEVAPARIGAHTQVQVAASAPGEPRQPCPPPPGEMAPGQWSAFVAPDLAALFSGEPWLDLEPSPEAQADLLTRLQSTRLADLERALERLGPAVPRSAPALSAGDQAAWPAQPAPQGGGESALHPKAFLLQVMNDPAIDLHLRIEAAKALLPGFDGPGSS